MKRLKPELIGYKITSFGLSYCEIAQIKKNAVDIVTHYRSPKDTFKNISNVNCVFKVKPATTSLKERMRLRKEQQFLIQLHN